MLGEVEDESCLRFALVHEAFAGFDPTFFLHTTGA